MKQNLNSAEVLPILRLLAQRDDYGYSLLTRLEAASDERYRDREAALYPVLHELERRGLVTAEYRDTRKGKVRRYYELSGKGRRRLRAMGAGGTNAAGSGGRAVRKQSEPEPDEAAEERGAETRRNGYDARYDPAASDFTAEDLERAMEDGEEHDPRIDPASEEYEWQPTMSGPWPDAPKMSPELEAWMKKALRKLYAPRLRRQISRELAEHFEDCAADLTRADLSWREARDAALVRLGAPEELAKPMKRIHKPWMSWARTVVRTAILLTALALCVALINNKYALSNLEFETQKEELQSFNLLPRDDDERKLIPIARRDCSSEGSLRWGSFTVSPATVWCNYSRTDYVGSDGRSGSSTSKNDSILLHFTAAPWHKPIGVETRLRVADDRGVVYTTHERAWRKMIYCSMTRTRPWTWTLRICFNALPDEVKWLEISTEQEPEEKIRIDLGPWRLLTEGLPALEDEAAAVQAESRNIRYDDVTSCIVEPELVSIRSWRPVEGEAGAMRVSVPMVRQIHYRENPNEAARKAENLQLEHWDPVDGELMECILLLRGDPESFPIFIEEMVRRIEIRVPGESEPLPFSRLFRSTALYSDACLLHLYREAVDGAERYELKYEAEGEASCTLTLEPVKEDAP